MKQTLLTWLATGFISLRQALFSKNSKDSKPQYYQLSPKQLDNLLKPEQKKAEVKKEPEQWEKDLEKLKKHYNPNTDVVAISGDSLSKMFYPYKKDMWLDTTGRSLFSRTVVFDGNMPATIIRTGGGAGLF